MDNDNTQQSHGIVGEVTMNKSLEFGGSRPLTANAINAGGLYDRLNSLEGKYMNLVNYYKQDQNQLSSSLSSNQASAVGGVMPPNKNSNYQGAGIQTQPG